MERASRVVVIASLALAVLTHGWLAQWQPALAPTTWIAFALTFAIARVSLRAALLIVGGTAYLAPAVLSLAFGADDYHLMLVWLAAAAGPLLARADWSRWHVPRIWLIPIVGWALVVALTWPVIAGREVDFTLVAARTLHTTQGVSGAPPPVAGAFVTIFAIGQLMALLWLDLLFAHFRGRSFADLFRIVALPFVVSAAIGAAVAVYQGLVDITWLNPRIWSTDNRAGALMQDANTFGTGAAIWAPIAVAGGWAGIAWKWLAFAGSALLVAGMWLSGSRTALLALSAGMAGVIIGSVQRLGVWQPRIGRIVLLLAVALLILTAAIIPRDFQSSSPVSRLFARVPRLERAELTRFADELWNRFGYGRAAGEMIREHPLTGVGIGAFHLLGPDYIYRANEGFRRVGGDNAQNWWRHQVAELGVVGALPSLTMSMLILYAATRSIGPDDHRGTVAVLRGVVVGIGAASLLGVPTQHPVTGLSVAVALFLWAESGGIPQSPAVRRVASGWWAAAIAIAMATAVGQSVSASGALRVAHRSAAFGLPYSYGFSPAQGLAVSGEMRWMRERAVSVMRVEAAWLAITFWHPQPQSAEPVFVTLTVNGREIFDGQIQGPEPQTYYLQSPAEARWMCLELTAAPSRLPHSLGVSTQWQPHVPPSAAPDRVIR